MRGVLLRERQVLVLVVQDFYRTPFLWNSECATTPVWNMERSYFSPCFQSWTACGQCSECSLIVVG